MALIDIFSVMKKAFNKKIMLKDFKNSNTENEISVTFSFGVIYISYNQQRSAISIETIG